MFRRTPICIVLPLLSLILFKSSHGPATVRATADYTRPFGIYHPSGNKTLREVALWYSINFFTSHIFLREIQQSLVDILFNVVCIIIDHAVSDLANNNSLRLLDFQSRQTSQPQRERKEAEEARERFFFSVFSLFLFCVLNDSLDEA